MEDIAYAPVSRMEMDVQEHGEVHADIEGFDEPVDIRKGTWSFDHRYELMTREADSEPTLRIPMDSVVGWVLPEG